MKKVLSWFLMVCLMLTAVSAAGADGLKDLIDYEIIANELTTWNILYSQSAIDLDVLSNLWDGLLTNGTKGELLPGIAESWGSEDGGQTWTFKLKSNAVWCDKDANVKADVVASDWQWGLEWILNFAKNEAANTSMPIEMIKGAEEYYEYTKALAESDGEDAAMALGLDKFKEMVAVDAPDDQTLVITCLEKMAYFPTVATYNCLYPLSGKFVEENGAQGVKSMDWETMWYNGPYLVSSFISGNEKVLVKNPTWYGTDSVFDSVTVKMVESHDVAYQLFNSGELDRVELTQSNLTTIFNSPSNQWHDYLVEARPTQFSYQFHLNYGKNNEDGTPDTNWNTAIANEAFRLSWYYGLDMTPLLSRINAIHPQSSQNYAYTANGVSVASDGRDYTALVLDELGLAYDRTQFNRVDPEKGAAYKKQAMEELSAKGVTFPVTVDYYIAGGNQTALDTANAIKQMFSDCLGDDYAVINIKSYVSSFANEVRNPRLHSFAITGWGADFGDPVNFLGQETYGEDNSYFGVRYSNVNDITDEALIATYQEFTSMVNDARAISDDYDARLAAFAKAEKFFIEHALSIPCYYNIVWQLTRINDYSKVYCAYGIQVTRYVNWETTENDAYTSEEYAAFAAAQ